ncbi:response regulator [Salarchaeum sp. JOR-1]|uniref:response regulator n=1 Tax=Salarchaeum sp. JOR-1 TaxID=2599399 RepID=UPI0011986AE1|nr:response regulator [Salarchaeum sp. JOR-1]QDX39550.1 response regulator [Salarchaeum sp. JOR-1]
MSDEGPPIVLVVDDEPDMTRLYEAWLSGEYEVWVANDGHEALERIDERVDLVFLDRRMPDLLGREVLERIREREYGCRVAMLTAVAPDVDIIRMGFDDYLTKPVDREDVLTAADRLLSLDQYDDSIQELYVLVEKRNSLERAVSRGELEENAAYSDLENRIEDLEERLDETVREWDDNNFRAMFREL